MVIPLHVRHGLSFSQKCNMCKLMLPIMNRERGMSIAHKGSWLGCVHVFVDSYKELFTGFLRYLYMLF